MAFSRLHTIRKLHQSLQSREISPLLQFSRTFTQSDLTGSNRKFSTFSSIEEKSNYPLLSGSSKPLSSMLGTESSLIVNAVRSMSTKVQAPPQARNMGAIQVAMRSPGIVYEPYAPREPISFFRRWFTRSGWRRTKEDMLLELKSAYAITKLRKAGYSKKRFYIEAVQMYKEINTYIANGDKTALKKVVTELMYSAMKNEIKYRESNWSGIYWELVEPVKRIRTLRARLLGVDPKDLSKVFVQLTLEFLTNQKFALYNEKGEVVGGDKDKVVLVRDIWVFEKSMFHKDARWRLCGRINVA